MMDEPEVKIDIGCVSHIKIEVCDDFEEDFSSIRGEFVIESSSSEPIVEKVIKVELPDTESNNIEEIAQENEANIEYDENGIEIKRKLRGRTLYGPGNKFINNGNKTIPDPLQNPVPNTFFLPSPLQNNSNTDKNKENCNEAENALVLEEKIVEIKQEVVQELSEDLFTKLNDDNTVENDTPPPTKLQKLVSIDTMIEFINEVAIGQNESTFPPLEMNEEQLNPERSRSEEVTSEAVATEKLIQQTNPPETTQSQLLINNPTPTQLSLQKLSSGLGYTNKEEKTTGNTLLHKAALNCDAKAVKALLQNGGMNVNALNKAGNTALHCLCSSKAQTFHGIEKMKQIFQMLLNFGAVTRIKNQRGLTPLHILFTKTKFTPNHFHLFVQFLYKNNLLHALEIFEDKGISTPLFRATRAVEIQDRTLELLFKVCNLNPNLSNRFGQNLFHFAIWGKRTLRFFKRLLANGVKLDNTEISSFHLFQFALHKCVSFTYLAFLLEHEQSLMKKKKSGQSVIDCAMDAKRSYFDIINLLVTIHNLKRKAQGYSGRSTKSGLRIVMEQGRIKILNYLLENGLDVNEFDPDGWTPFNLAMRSRSKPLRKARLLLRFGANPFLRNRDGDAALHIAFKWGNPAALKYCLQELGFDPNCKDSEARTPLRLIFDMKKFNTKEILKKARLLVENNADLFYIKKCTFTGFEGEGIYEEEVSILEEARLKWNNNENFQFFARIRTILI